jgi:hypothetical protein
MITVERRDISADRWVACIRLLPFVNADFTDAAFLMHVRQTPDVSGTALATLTTQTTEAAEGIKLHDVAASTITAHRTAGRLGQTEPQGINPATAGAYADSDSVTVSRLRIRINETTMEAMPFPGSGDTGERGDDVVLWYDIHITPSGGTKDRYVFGTFTVRAGTTQ